jgi:hypothetical protein
MKAMLERSAILRRNIRMQTHAFMADPQVTVVQAGHVCTTWNEQPLEIHLAYRCEIEHCYHHPCALCQVSFLAVHGALISPPARASFALKLSV